MSSPIGVMIGSSVTPAFVTSGGDVPTMNWIWAIPSYVSMVMCVFLVRSSYPPTPPSRSAEVGHDYIPIATSLKLLFTNPTYLLLFWIIGSVVGFFNCFATQLEQFLCATGYDSQYAGFGITFMILAGTIGSAILGIISEMTGQVQFVTQACSGLAVLIFIPLAIMFGFPDLHAGMMVFMVL